MSLCSVCSKSVNRTGQEKILCVDCNSYFHLQCVNLTTNELPSYADSGYRCSKCLSTCRGSRGPFDDRPINASSSQSDERPVTVNVMKGLLSNIKKEIIDSQNSMERELGASISSCHEKIADLTRLLDEQIRIVKGQEELIQGLKSENAGLRKTVDSLKMQVDNLDQYGRRNTLEIRGVPVCDGENLINTVVNLSKALSVDVDERVIDACHRLRKKSDGRPPTIVVKFNRRVVVDGILDAQSKRKDLSSRHIGMASDSKVYINLSLTKERQSLLYSARCAKKSNSIIEFVWADRSGRIKISDRGIKKCLR